MDTDSENKLIDQFEEEVKSGVSPNIERLLALFPEESRQRILFELISIQIYHTIRKGFRSQRSDYSEFGEDAVEHAKRVRAEVENQFFAKPASSKLQASDLSGQVSETPTRSRPPQTIGPYKLIEPLGEGGMGIVWLAQQDQPVKRRVALKLVRSELTSSEVLARLSAEKQALSMMSHPNIAQFLDAGTADDGRPYFVMELVEGIPITQYCDEHRLGVDGRLKLFVSVCKAVQHAHQKGIVHRDLKPTNVLITEMDGEAVPKVIDFGLAKAVDQHLRLTEETLRTEFGKIVGTVQYMSPEQAELRNADSEDIDTRTDVYSLGVMLYELLTGSTPVDKAVLSANALLRILQMIREDDPPRPSDRLSSSSHEVNADVSDRRRLHPARLKQLLQGELDWVVMKAIEKQPDRRYQAASDLAHDLSNYLIGETVSARPPSKWYQIRKFTQRNRELVGAVLAIGIALIAGIIGTSYGLIRANEKTQLAEEKTSEAETERLNAQFSEHQALSAKKTAVANEQRARDSEADATFQLAIARYDAHQANVARSLLHQIPDEYRDNFEWHYCNQRFQGSNVTCYGHTSSIDGVAYTPDGSQMVSASHDGTVRLWDTSTGLEINRINLEDERPVSIAISRDGSRVATASDETIKLWDIKTHEVIGRLDGHSEKIICLSFNDDGSRLASASSDNAIKVWDINSAEEVIAIGGNTVSVTSFAFSPNGKQLASASEFDWAISIWDIESGELIEVVRNRSKANQIAFSPDGSRLVSVHYGLFVIWDTETWLPVFVGHRSHNRVVRCVAFSPDGTRFATSGDDCIIKLWDTRTGGLLDTLSGHSQSIFNLAFSPDGSHLASSSSDTTVKIWRVSNNDGLMLAGHVDHVYAVAFDSFGEQMATGGADGVIILRNARTGCTHFRIEGNSKAINKLSFSPDGIRIASAGDDNSIRIWDTQTGEQIAVLAGHESSVSGLDYSPDGSRLVSSSRDGTVKLWDMTTFQETMTLRGHHSIVYDVAFSPDGMRIVSAGGDALIRLWDVQSGNEIRTFNGHVGLVRSVAFAPNGKRIASGGYDPNVRIWDVSSGQQVGSARAGVGAVFTLAYSPDGKRIAVGGTDREVRLIDATSGKVCVAFPPLEGGVADIAFKSDNSMLAVAIGSPLGTARIWESPRTSELRILSGHSSDVTDLTFGVDDSRICSQAIDEKLVWNAANGELIVDAAWEPPDVTKRVSENGRWFLTSDSKDVVLVDLEFKRRRVGNDQRMVSDVFDPYWHRNQGNASMQVNDWFSAVFHYGWLIKNFPDSLEYYVALQSAYRNLVAKNRYDIESVCQVRDITSNHHGRFYSELVKVRAAIVPTVKSETEREFDEHSASEKSSNGAMVFDGASLVEIGELPFCESSFTVEGWFKYDWRTNLEGANSTGAVFTVASSEKYTAVGAEVFADGRLRVVHRNPPHNIGGINLISRTNVADQQWHHLAVVRGDDAKLRLFINGELEDISEVVVDDFESASYPVNIGMNVKQNPRYFTGLMDDIRFWSRARSGEEIIAGMHSPVEPASPGLVAAYDFDDEDQILNPIENVTPDINVSPVVIESLKSSPMSLSRKPLK
ncbi:MAG: protein kinase [Pirellulaceae bacterium]